jgi:hypothetical protein
MRVRISISACLLSAVTLGACDPKVGPAVDADASSAGGDARLGSAPPDAHLVDALTGPTTDAAVVSPIPDAAVVSPIPDAAVPPVPDAAVPPVPDAVVPPVPDTAIPPQPDAALPPTPDAAVPPTPDAAVPPTPDAAVVQIPDAAAPIPDAAVVVPIPDAAVPPVPDAAPPPDPLPVCRQTILGFEVCFPGCLGLGAACADDKMCVAVGAEFACVSDCRVIGCPLPGLACNVQTGYCDPPAVLPDLGRACTSTDDCASCCRWHTEQFLPADEGDPYYWTCEPVPPGAPEGGTCSPPNACRTCTASGGFWIYDHGGYSNCDDVPLVPQAPDCGPNAEIFGCSFVPPLPLDTGHCETDPDPDDCWDGCPPGWLCVDDRQLCVEDTP